MVEVNRLNAEAIRLSDFRTNKDYAENQRSETLVRQEQSGDIGREEPADVHP